MHILEAICGFFELLFLILENPKLLLIVVPVITVIVIYFKYFH
jgi:hypothetical protein